jgi:hypothetical protein
VVHVQQTTRLVPADDTLTVAPGYLGNIRTLFDVPVAEIETFARALARCGPRPRALASRWGVRRTSPTLWPTVDWIHDDFRRREPTEFGLFDLNPQESLIVGVSQLRCRTWRAGSSKRQ